MKIFLSLCAVVVTAAIVSAEDVLKEENAKVIQNEQQFKEFYACLINQAPCPDKLKTLKEAIPTYIRTNCGDCSANEKEMFEKFSKMILEKYPNEHKELVDKFGPKAA